MARYTSASFTSAAVEPGEYEDQDLTVAGSKVDLASIAVSASAARGGCVVELYRKSARAAVDLAWSSGPFVTAYEVPKAQIGYPAEEMTPWKLSYEDESGTAKLHFRLWNGDGVAKTFTVTVEYEVPTGTSVFWYDVRDYGAECDGVTDDTAAVQLAIDTVAALNSGAGGGVVLIPPYCKFGSSFDARWQSIDLKKNASILDYSDVYGRPAFVSHGQESAPADDNEVLIHAPHHPALILDIPKFKSDEVVNTAITDLVADAAHTSNFKVTSALYGTFAADTGKYLYVTGGSGWTVGVYRIASISGSAAVLHKAAASNDAVGGQAELSSSTRFNRGMGTRLFGLSHGFQLTSNGDGTTEFNLYTNKISDPLVTLARYYRLFFSNYDDGGKLGIMRGAPVYNVDIDGVLRVGLDATNGKSGATDVMIILQEVDSAKAMGIVLDKTTGDLYLQAGVTPAEVFRFPVGGNSIIVKNSKTPASKTAVGSTGQICWDSDYLYVCVSGGIEGAASWKRVAISDSGWT